MDIAIIINTHGLSYFRILRIIISILNLQQQTRKEVIALLPFLSEKHNVV